LFPEGVATSDILV